MQKQYPQVELDISITDDEIEAAIREALPLTQLEHIVQSTLIAAGITEPVSLTLLMTGDAAMQEMNKRFRQQDKPTDVLSFPLLDKPLVHAPSDQLWLAPKEDSNQLTQTTTRHPVFVTPSELPTHLGDIVISWPTVVQQAKAAGHSPAYELQYLLAHGVLHLVGYDDQTEAGYTAMVHLQESVLQVVGWKEAQ